MRGLTDAEYEHLAIKAAGREWDVAWHDEPLNPKLILRQGLVTQRRVEVDRVRWGDGDRGPVTVHRITPLGRLALALWPAIRSGR